MLALGTVLSGSHVSAKPDELTAEQNVRDSDENDQGQTPMGRPAHGLIGVVALAGLVPADRRQRGSRNRPAKLQPLRIKSCIRAI
jgi:hypothetical protein